MTDAADSRRRRAGPARWLVAALCGVLGFALVTSAHTNRTPSSLSTARPDDLVRILDGLTGQEDRLRQQADTLAASVQQLQSGRDAAAAALTDAQRQVDALGILAGTTPAYGPGIVLRLADPRHQLKADTLLDAVEELRDAGAEALQVGPVRIVASTPFTDGSGGISAGGILLHQPYQLLAIGDAHTLADAMRFPGGVVDTVAQDGGTATVSTPATVQVTALRSPSADRYARPVPSAAASPNG